MDFYIKSAKFQVSKLHNPNSANQLNFSRINVFVGSNNCGKTQILKDLSTLFDLRLNPKNILLDSESILLAHPNTKDELISKCSLDLKEDGSSSYTLHYMPAMLTGSNKSDNIHKTDLLNCFIDEIHFKKFVKGIGQAFVTYLNTDMRLELSKRVNDMKSAPGSSTTWPMYDGILGSDNPDEKIRKINEWFKKIFDVDIWLTNNSYGGITFRYNFTEEEAKKSGSINAQKSIDNKHRPIDEQGDGMRAVLSIICGLLANKKPIIFIDEPETFLHPGQVYALGRCIGEIIGNDRQIFISTHSADFLRGLFSSAYDDLTVTRLYRYTSDDTVDYFQLDNNKLAEVSRDSISSTYNILDGLFHQACVVCEGDKDVLIYQSMINKINSVADIHVIPTTGYRGMTSATDLYRTMKVKHAVILDCDCVLNNKQNNTNLNCPITSIFDERVSNTNEQGKLQVLLKKLDSAFTYTTNPQTGNPTGIDKNERNEFKNKLQDFLKKHNMEQCYKDITELANKYGIFLTQEGQLEAWFQDDPNVNKNFDANDSKTSRYEKIVEAIFSLDDDTLTKTELGNFISSIVDYLEK